MFLYLDCVHQVDVCIIPDCSQNSIALTFTFPALLCSYHEYLRTDVRALCFYKDSGLSHEFDHLQKSEYHVRSS
jgi:hypothetical protein